MTRWPCAVHADFTRSRTHRASAATRIVLTAGTLVGTHEVASDRAQGSEVVDVVAELGDVDHRGIAHTVFEARELRALADRDVLEVGEIGEVRGESARRLTPPPAELAGAVAEGARVDVAVALVHAVDDERIDREVAVSEPAGEVLDL